MAMLSGQQPRNIKVPGTRVLTRYPGNG